MNRFLILLLALLGSVASAVFFWTAGTPDIDLYHQQSIAVGNSTRHYTLVVPRELSAECPLVFAFHGTGDTPESMANYSDLSRLAAQHRFVLVYPAAAESVWDTRFDSADTRNPDLQFFDSLLRELTAQHNVDLKRVYAVGMSNGASFALLLAAARSDQVAAVVAHSGTRPPIDSSAVSPSPALLIVGYEDPVHDSIVTDANMTQMECVIVSGLGHEWSAAHNTKIWKFLHQHINTNP